MLIAYTKHGRIECKRVVEGTNGVYLKDDGEVVGYVPYADLNLVVDRDKKLRTDN